MRKVPYEELKIGDYFLFYQYSSNDNRKILGIFKIVCFNTVERNYVEVENFEVWETYSYSKGWDWKKTVWDETLSLFTKSEGISMLIFKLSEEEVLNNIVTLVV